MTRQPVADNTKGHEAQEGWEAYQRVREAVVRLVGDRRPGVGPDSGPARPSAYWREELSNIDYMIDASPLVVRKLRHHAFHVTGIRPYDYRAAGDERSQHFKARFRKLLAMGGEELLVPEHEALGGFGYTIDGRLFNVDTMKFLEVLVGMRRAGVIEPFRRPSRRMLAWEIGAGWGGFAYQFKTLFPSTTYVIVDFPELFLFSAVYLQTVCPGAAIRIWGETDDPLADWAQADFIFVPNTEVDALRALQPDLLVNLVSFQEMTRAQVEQYARLAAGIACPALYSLNRERSRYNDELAGVSEILGQYYDLREVRLFEADYTKSTKKGSAVTTAEARAVNGKARDGDLQYRHLAGTLRPGAQAAAHTRGAAVVASEGSDPPGEGSDPRLPTTDARRPSQVAIGLTLYNRAPFLRDALDSLLAQSYPHFRIVLVDDCSSDGTEAIAREYAARDPRVTYHRNEQRLAMVGTWRRAFELATAAGDAEYFAWASDHDRWHRDWLRQLVDELDRHPEAVLTYPLTHRIDAEGTPLGKPSRLFETLGMASLDDRWDMVARSDSVAAGDMVYGLMRVAAARQAGVFRDVLCPDRLLIAELAIAGQFIQVPEVLWWRRQFNAGSIGRQRHTLFAAGTAAPPAWMPPWWMHGRALWQAYVRDGSPLGGTRGRSARLVGRYGAAYAWRHHRKSTVHRRLGAMIRSLGWFRKKARHYLLQALFYTLVYGRRAYHNSVYYALVGLRRAGVTPALESAYRTVTGRERSQE